MNPRNGVSVEVDHVFSQAWRRMRSSLRAVTSSSDLIGVYRGASSAKRRISDVTVSGRSLINTRKRRGPRTIPCESPDMTLDVLLAFPSRMTCCVWPIRKL